MTQKENESLSFERALEELEKIVKTLEGGHDTLENSIELYERGMQLKKICEKKLEEAVLKIEKVQLNASGAVQGTTEITEL